MFSDFVRLVATVARRIGSDRGGNVAITFALAAIPLVGATGIAIDFSRANWAQGQLQAALDSTTLLLSREAAGESTAVLNANALAYMQAQFTRTDSTGLIVTPTYTTDGGSQIVATATAAVSTTIGGIFGLTSIGISATSTVKWGSSRLRVALVLDNTGSMAQSGKMSALKTATANLLAQLKAAATTNGDVYVSIIPFSKDVNVGSSNYAASWIDWTDWEEENGSCSSSRYTTKSTCTAARATWIATSHSKWNGCVADRGNSSAPSSGNYDTNVTAPSTTITATLFPAEQYSNCPTAVMPLSYDWSSMTSLVSNMASKGNTNQAIGLAHGWMSLVGGGPYTVPAKDSNYTYSEIIILFTDGLNTENRWYTSQSAIDARETLTCSNVKAAGITLYTVQVSTDGTAASSLLRNCASDTSKFFYLTSASDIVTTFASIGTNLSNLYLAK
ncbi:TadE/TadG family type IV pilus assembly protein [Pseudolabrys sp. FHR47]|uniref:TadE/TadG family type IV pilus assembly protein n=1 Tax=Pseudolabrys sp. FHR47 TaxID=2562284 RepID=UPI00143CE39A|nr:TadE/TadG family type IV pilus assembly protein [Pseudolabrys sp. FHR47]